MTLALILRLLGFLRIVDADERAVLDARQRCVETLGLVDSIADAQLIARVSPLLQWRDLELPRADEPESAVIAGVVADEQGGEGLSVELVNVDIRGQALDVRALVVATKRGEFAVAYSRAGVRLIGVRVSRQGRIIHTSAPMRAESSFWFEWAVSGSPSRPGMFEVREAWLEAELASSRLTLGGLIGAANGESIAALSALSGASVEQVKHHVIAAKVAGELGIPSDVVAALVPPPPVAISGPQTMAPMPPRMAPVSFGLARPPAGPFVTDAELDRARELVLDAADADTESLLREAASVGQLTTCHASQLGETVGRLRRAYAATRSSASPLLQHLVAAGIPRASVDALGAYIAVNPRHDASSLLGSDVVSGEEGGRLREALELVELAGNDGRVLAGLCGTSSRSVARLPVEILASRLEAAIPREGRDELLATIATNSDARHAGDALLRRRHVELTAPTREFVAHHGDAFNLATDSLRDRLALSGGDLKPATFAELAPLQRLLRVAGNAAVADALYRLGYRSAQQIAFVDQSKLVAELASQGVDADVARKTHRRARGRYRATVEAYLRLDPHAAGPDLAVLGAEAGLALRSLPTYSFLFGSQDFGPVESWESVTSPAAYLVDLLVWLSAAPAVTGAQHPYSVLRARRPELVEIILDRANTETLVPHIDLVCELLEDAAAARLNGAAPATTRQTRHTAEEIRAYPEYVNRDVYAALAGSTATMRLPFDLPLAEARAYLGLKGLDRAWLQELFGWSLFEVQPGGAPSQRAQDLAAELLGLNKLDFVAIATAKADDASQKAIWNQKVLPFDGLAPFMSRAPALAQPREHLSYDGVLALLDSAIVNPGRALKLALIDPTKPDRCRAEERKFATPLDAKALDRIHRFLRLARARAKSCSLAELDALLAAAGGKLDPSSLVALAALTRAQVRLGLDNERLAALFRPFSLEDATTIRADGTSSLYRRLFLVRTDAQKLPAIFTDPNVTAPLDGKLAARLGAALNVPTDEMTALASLAKVDVAKVAFKDVWQLYRYALLARTACPSLSIPSFASVVAVLENPLASLQRLQEFLDDLRLLGAERLAMDDLGVVAEAAAPTLPRMLTLDDALRTLVEETKRLLHAPPSEGAPPPTDADARTAILTRLTWLAPVASWLGLDPRLAEALRSLDAAIPSALLDPASASRPAALVRVARWAQTITALRVSPIEAESLRLLEPMSGLANKPSWRTARLALKAIGLARSFGAVDAVGRYAERRALSSGGGLATCASELAGALKLEAPAVTSAWRGLDPQDPPTRALDPSFLSRVVQLASVMASIGAPAAEVAGWLGWPTTDDAAAIRNAVRAKLPQESWLSLSRAVQDPLRERKRDALVDYVSAVAPANANPDVVEPSSVDDFMGLYLIDVEMGDCRDTSRITQATAAIQLLVQRCFLGLESGIVQNPDDARELSHWQQWDWRKRYRLWEANRRIFLYPENFLEVGRASNTSPLFDVFRKKMAQTEINETTVADALEEYIIALEAIARLDYQALDLSADGTVLGAVARSSGGTPAFYYRRFRGVWTPWEEVTLSPNPTSIVLAQGATRAWLAWPTLTQHVHPVQPLPTLSGGSSGVDAEKNAGRGLIHARYSWSMRDDRGAWSSVKTTSRASVMTPRAAHGFVVMAQPDFPSPHTFQLLLYVPEVSTAGRDVKYAFSMEIVRDAARSWVQNNVSFPGGAAELPSAEPRWREHYAEYRLSAPVANDAILRPWDNFHFDGNRMIAGAQQPSAVNPREFVLVNDVALTVPFANGASPSTTLLTAKVPLAVTKAQAIVQVASYQTPKADAFVVSGSVVKEPSPTGLRDRSTRWSMLMLAPPTAQGLLASTQLKLPEKKFVTIAAYHPFATELVSVIRTSGLRALYQPSLQSSPGIDNVGRVPLAFGTALTLSQDAVGVVADGAVVAPNDATAREAFDFDAIAPYALYNWELFYDAPLLLAQRLTSNLRFREAQNYYHFVFNPFSTENSQSRARFWVTKPFRKDTVPVDVNDILIDAAGDPRKAPWQIIERSPFDANAVAQTRPSALQRYVVMSYLDNLVAWGDLLYRQGTAQASREDVNEATSIYEIARTILGERPNRVRPLGAKRVRAFKKVEDWLGGSNVLVELENTLSTTAELDDDADLVHLPLLPSRFVGDAAAPKSLYFRVPPNEKLLDYWEVVAGRLANIRACLTLDGAVANLPLTAAPIDPKALADAAALGVSVADAIAMANAAPPIYRFRVMLAKARESCEEVRGLGAALLVALEKQDGEHVATVRSRFEQPVLSANRNLKHAQRRQVEREVDALKSSRAAVEARKKFYSERTYMSELEQASFDLSLTAGVLGAASAILDFAAGGLQLIPDAALGLSGFGGTPHANIKYGGTTVATSASHWSKALSVLGGIADRSASMVSTQAGYARRKEDWDHQADQAALELKHLDVQVAAANLRLAVIDAELATQDAQDRAWAQNDRLLREKFTNKELYAWQVQRLTDVYLRAFEQAFKLAGHAHQAFEFETNSRHERPPYDSWDRGKNGLLAGEELGRYLRDLDFEYHGRRLHERVINQHVSLRQLAPAAYVNLVTTGSTGVFTIPAWRLAQLYPGVQQRRIRSVSVSIPCVAGAYANVNATLRVVGSPATLVKSVSLSTGRDDFGWDMATRGEAYVPFEGIDLDQDTSWQLDFPVADGGRPDVALSSIADVVLHVEYGAHEGKSAVQLPGGFTVVVDVARAAPDVWSALVASNGSHTASFDASPLIPSFLENYHLERVSKAVALDVAGNVISPVFDCKPDTASGGDIVKISALGGDVVWSNVGQLIMVLDVAP